MMKQEFFRGTTLTVRITFFGFAVATIGVATGFLSFYIDQRWLGMSALALTVIGVVIGFAGVAYGWIHDGKQAIKESTKGVNELRAKLQGK